MLIDIEKFYPYTILLLTVFINVMHHWDIIRYKSHFKQYLFRLLQYYPTVLDNLLNCIVILFKMDLFNINLNGYCE